MFCNNSILYSRIKVIAALLIFMTGYNSLRGQDVHFSQFTTHPITLNPALTGAFNGCKRLAVIYRNQWNTVSIPFTTYSISFDEHLLNKKLNLKNRLGFGVHLLNDKSGKNTFSSIVGQVSLAWHRILDYNSKHRISVGIQTGFVQKAIDFANVKFGSQYNPKGFLDRDIPNGEYLTSSSFLNLDINAGMVYSYHVNEVFQFSTGYALYHLTKPTETFIADVKNKLQRRHAAFFEGIVAFNKKFRVEPSVLFMHQNASNLLISGLSASYVYGRTALGMVSFQAGTWYRNKDAFILSAGAKINNKQFRLGYDWNISGLVPASQSIGGFEVSVILTGVCKVSLPKRYAIPCKRF